MSPPPPTPTRRAVLVGALATVVGATAGCRTQESPAVSTDDGVKQRVLASKQALLDRCTATAERHPSLAARLAPLIAAHRAHIQALTPAGPAGSPMVSTPPTEPGKPAPGSSPAPATPPPRPEVPAEVGAAVAALITTETAAANSRLRDVLDSSPPLARVLASISGCEAGHAELLRAAP